MLKTEHRQGRAVVKVVSDITEGLAIELVAHIRRLRDECFHERVELEIASDGGSVLALGYFLDALDEFRASGLEVVTRALTSAASDLVASDNTCSVRAKVPCRKATCRRRALISLHSHIALPALHPAAGKWRPVSLAP